MSLNENIRKEQAIKIVEINRLLSEFTLNYIYQTYNDNESASKIQYSELYDIQEKIKNWKKNILEK